MHEKRRGFRGDEGMDGWMMVRITGMVDGIGL